MQQLLQDISQENESPAGGSSSPEHEINDAGNACKRRNYAVADATRVDNSLVAGKIRTYLVEQNDKALSKIQVHEMVS